MSGSLDNFNFLTLVVADVENFDLDGLYSLCDAAPKSTASINILYAGTDELKRRKATNQPNLIFLEENYKFQDGSAKAVVFDPQTGLTTYLCIAESSDVIHQLAGGSRSSYTKVRYCVACRPFLSPVLIEDTVRLGYLHLPAYDAAGIASTTTHALSRMQRQESNALPRPSRPASARRLRRKALVDLRERTPSLAQVERMIAEEIVRSSDGLSRVRMSAPFLLRGFQFAVDVTETNECVTVAKAAGHHAIYGPYMSLAAGNYKISFLMDTLCHEQNCQVIADVSVLGKALTSETFQVLATKVVSEWFHFEFELIEDADHSLEFRLILAEGNDLRIHGIDLVRMQ